MVVPSDYDREEKERPSWREIDRRRDRSRHVSRGEKGGRQKSFRSAWVKKQYLKEVDKHFQGVRGSKAHAEALAAVHRHYGTTKFGSAVKKYLKAYGLPRDWGTLMLLLDYKDEQVVGAAMEALQTLARERSVLERQGFRDKLEILTLTGTSSKVASLAQRLLQED